MRSKWKVKFLDRSHIRYILNKSIFDINKKLKIYSRNSTISGYFINKEVYIHNGLRFKKLMILRKLVGFKFGEFSFTKQMGSKIHEKNN